MPALAGYGELLWPGQAICGHDSLWPLMERSLLRTDHILLENRTGGSVGDLEMVAKLRCWLRKRMQKVVSDREKEGN